MKNRNRVALFLTIASISVLFALPLYAGESDDSNGCDEHLLIQAALKAGFATNALRKIEEGDTEKAKEILRFLLTSSLEEADRLAETSRPPEIYFPNLIESLRRARDYVEDHSLDPRLITAADKAMKQLQKER